MQATRRLYWLDDHCVTAEAVVTGIRESSVAVNQTCFYAGGGGQPADHGTIERNGTMLDVTGMALDAAGVLWHHCGAPPDDSWLNQRVRLALDAARREALSRYHTVLHVLNTIALRDYNAWITGAQIAVDYARIDFKWDGFTPAVCTELEGKINAELVANRRLIAYTLTEDEFLRRPELLRTLEVKPPVVDGRVRVVEIEGFDAQACGGTHVSHTGELGIFRITRTENKGKINKRVYVGLGGLSA